MTTNTSWIVEFCNGYAPLALQLAKLFIFIGLLAGVFMAAAEVYKVYREAKAIRPPADADPRTRVLAAPAAGEIIKNLVGLLTGAKAWLALVILGVVLLWLAGSGVPGYCTPTAPAGQQPQQQSGAPAPGTAR